MRIRILTVGKLKEKYWVAAVEEYLKRMSAYAKVSIVEIKEYKLPAKAYAAEEAKVREKEGIAILENISDSEYVITLEINGNLVKSEELAEQLDGLAASGKSNLVFVIGGSLGLGDNVLARSDYSLSFSPMTFPHQMTRVILVEQLYRSFKINHNETYHK